MIWETTVTKEAQVIVGNKNDARFKNKSAEAGRAKTTNRFNFVIFQNYDGSTTSRVMTREMYNKLFPDACSS